MPTKITRISKTKFRIEGSEKIFDKELVEMGICPECMEELPEPKLEARGYGHSEFVTYCPCGATYKS